MGNEVADSGMATAPMETDGSFVVEITSPTFTDGITYYVHTRQGHGGKDPTQIVSTPLVFKPAPTFPQIEVFLDDGTTPVGNSPVKAGDTLIVNGTGFDPALLGNGDPVKGQPAGYYVVMGSFADEWSLADGKTSSTRPNVVQKWALPEPPLNTSPALSGSNYTKLSDDGAFRAELQLPNNFDPETLTNGPGNFGIYTYSAGTRAGAGTSWTLTPDDWAARKVFETFTAITVAVDTESGNAGEEGGSNEETPPTSRNTAVSVTGASAPGLKLSVTGSGYGDLPKTSEDQPASGIYAAVLPSGTTPAAISGTAQLDMGSYPAITFIPKAQISDGSWSWSPTIPANALVNGGAYDILVWVAHGNATAQTILFRSGVGISAAQMAAIFPDGNDADKEDAGEAAEATAGKSSVVQGKSISFTGTGFEPGELVSGTVHSDPISLGSKTADTSGAVTFTWTVPDDFQAGAHRLELVGQSSGRTASVAFTVTKPDTTKAGSKIKVKPASEEEDAVCSVENIPAKAGTPTLSWGVRSSFTSYVEGGIANGTITVSSGAARSGSGFTWGTGTGRLKADGTGTLTFPGSVHFTGHEGVLNTTLGNLRVTITSSTGGTLTGTVNSQDMEGKTTASGSVTLANLTFSSLSATGGTASAILTKAGAAAFAGFYEAGEQLDGLTLAISGATKATTHTVCRNADGEIVDAAGAPVGKDSTDVLAAAGLANTGVRGVGTMAGLATLLILGGGALLLQERIRRTRASQQ